MKTNELKKQLVQIIAKIDDVAFLEAIQTILETKIQTGTKSQSEKNDNNIDQDDSENESLKWLYDR